MFELVKKFKKCLMTSINNINKEIKKRSRNISFKDVIYYFCILIGNNQSYDDVNANLKINNILNVSKTALIKYKKNIDCDFFIEINNCLLKHIYCDDNKRLLAVDGTIIVLEKSLKKYGFKMSRNGNYCITLISTRVQKEDSSGKFLFMDKKLSKKLIKYMRKLLNHTEDYYC